jgi:hypothetical protein
MGWGWETVRECASCFCFFSFFLSFLAAAMCPVGSQGSHIPTRAATGFPSPFPPQSYPIPRLRFVYIMSITTPSPQRSGVALGADPTQHNSHTTANRQPTTTTTAVTPELRRDGDEERAAARARPLTATTTVAVTVQHIRHHELRLRAAPRAAAHPRPRDSGRGHLHDRLRGHLRAPAVLGARIHGGQDWCRRLVYGFRNGVSPKPPVERYPY